jgi:hypothetical protein
MTKAFMFLKFNGRYFRGIRTDYKELMSFFITILFSIVIIASLALKTKLKKIPHSQQYSVYPELVSGSYD